MKRRNTEANRQLDELRSRLAAAEETLEAIRSGAVDALVVSGSSGDQLYTLDGAEHAYRVFVEAMNEGAATISADGSILYCNRCFADMVQKPLEDVIGRSIFEAIPPAEQKAFGALIQRSLESSAKAEVNFLTSDRTLVPAYVSLRSFNELGSRVLCMVITDLREQKRNEELLAAGKLARLLIEQAGEVVLVCDMQGRVLQASHALEQICGVNPLFQQFDEVLPLTIEPNAQNASPLPFSVQELLDGGSYRGIEVSYQPSHRERIHFLMSASAITREGAAIGCVVTLFDIEERKRAEESLRRSEKMAATGRMAASIAHEINNPLEAVTNLLYLIESSAKHDPTTLDYARTAQQELSRVANITRHTLAFYRESRQPQPVVLKDVVESILSLYASKAQEKNVVIEKQFLTDGRITALHNQIGQVVTNLLLNALEACPPTNGKLILRLYEAREWGNSKKTGVRLIIADNGPGISLRDRGRIFEPFFTTKGEKGTGLGLWVSQGILNRHQGFMRFRSSVHPERSGTVFSIFLPKAENPGQENVEQHPQH